MLNYQKSTIDKQLLLIGKIILAIKSDRNLTFNWRINFILIRIKTDTLTIESTRLRVKIKFHCLTILSKFENN